MKLATLNTGGDGTLLIVSRDLTRAVRAEAAPTLQDALEQWNVVSPMMKRQYELLNAGEVAGAMSVDTAELSAIMPRSFQFLDASAFLAHSDILAEAWGFEPRGRDMAPLMYQGLSNRFYAAEEDVPFADFSMEVDLEAELGVIVDAVPLGVTVEGALDHIKLVILINDWSLRRFGASEMRGGFGFIHAKPPSTLSAFAMTPDELGDAWRAGRVHLPLDIKQNGVQLGRPHGHEMHFGFHDLIAHAAATRDLCAGTVIGSGTVANHDAAVVGSGCIAEVRALDRIAGRDLTPFLSPGDQVQISLTAEGGEPVLGVISQRVVSR